MEIPRRTWMQYVRGLYQVNKKAAEEAARFVAEIGGIDGHLDEVIEYAYGLATRYGEAAAALACEMYDAIAEAQGALVPAALPAETATYAETARAVGGVLRDQNGTVPSTVGRLVKQAAADTMLQNAKRDGAQFAWVPMGDTCAFCMMLASNGWQYQSRKALKNGHAEHIHANCDCEYCVRFDGESGVEGYDPDKYLEKYNSAEGTTWKDKVNAMRREIYAENREEESD